MASVLLEKGANPTARNNAGLTPHALAGHLSLSFSLLRSIYFVFSRCVCLILYLHFYLFHSPPFRRIRSFLVEMFLLFLCLPLFLLCLLSVLLFCFYVDPHILLIQKSCGVLSYMRFLSRLLENILRNGTESLLFDSNFLFQIVTCIYKSGKRTKLEKRMNSATWLRGYREVAGNVQAICAGS